MERRSGLGKGLSALLPSDVDALDGKDAAPTLRELPIGIIEPNPFQPRVHFDEEALVELAASIREIGLLQPVLVRPTDGGRFQLIAGERRWRAAKRAGLDVIPAVIRPTDDLAAVEQALEMGFREAAEKHDRPSGQQKGRQQKGVRSIS